MIARVNLLMTFAEYLWDRWKRKPTEKEYETFTSIITWNVWQMDGLTGTIPYGTAEDEFQQFDLFGLLGMESEYKPEDKQPPCQIKNWLGGGKIIEYSDFPIGGKRAMKFEILQADLIQTHTWVQGWKLLKIRHFSRMACFLIAFNDRVQKPEMFVSGLSPERIHILTV